MRTLRYFRNTVGYWGAHYPTDPETKGLDVPFLLLEDTTQGFYVGRHSMAQRHLLTYCFQAKPGSLEQQFGLLPPGDRFGDHDVSVELMFQQFCYVAPGNTYTTDPIVVKAYQGDWTVGTDYYKAWRKTWYQRPPVPAWADDVHSWLQVQIYSAEDNICFKYKDLPDIAKQCQAHGIQAIQRTGWAYGGQDRGNPSHDTDPALGTLEDLQEAIRKCHKVLKLGADGMLFDELVHHGSAYYCFDKKHDHPRPAYLYAYDRALAQAFRQEAAKVNPDFLFSGEFWREEQMLEYSLGYTRFGGGHVPMHHYIDPKFLIMMAVPGFDDRDHINKCLERRYIISYEPFNFKGRPDDAPLTIAYGRKVDDLRRRYRKFLWDGAYGGPRGAAVKLNVEPFHAYAMYHATDGKRALIICNHDLEKAATVEIALQAPAGRLLMATPEAPEALPLQGTVPLPPRSALVVMEE